MKDLAQTSDSDVEEFAPAIRTGMRRAPSPPEDPVADAALRAKLDELDAVRTRGAVEAHHFWMDRTRR